MPHGTPQVLLVDDDRMSVLMMARVATRLGCHCVTARSGATAFREFARHRFDLVVTDLNMPGGDGAVLARRVRARSGVPVLLATAMDEASIAASGLHLLGGVQVLAKPYAPARLREAIESALAAPVQPLMASLESA